MLSMYSGVESEILKQIVFHAPFCFYLAIQCRHSFSGIVQRPIVNAWYSNICLRHFFYFFYSEKARTSYVFEQITIFQLIQSSPSLGTNKKYYRNIHMLSINYAFRPDLKPMNESKKKSLLVYLLFFIYEENESFFLNDQKKWVQISCWIDFVGVYLLHETNRNMGLAIEILFHYVISSSYRYIQNL